MFLTMLDAATILIILSLALLVFGPTHLPRLGRAIGRGMGNIRSGGDGGIVVAVALALLTYLVLRTFFPSEFSHRLGGV